MKLKHSKAWYAKNAAIEGQSEVGAGEPPPDLCPECGGNPRAIVVMVGSLNKLRKVYCKRCKGTGKVTIEPASKSRPILLQETVRAAIDNCRAKALHEVEWMQLGSTDKFAALKKDIAHVCRDVTNAACIDEICVSDIVATFLKHGYVVTKKN